MRCLYKLDFIFKKDSEVFDEIIFENKDFVQIFKTYFKIFRKKVFSFMREKMQKNFTKRVRVILKSILINLHL